MHVDRAGLFSFNLLVLNPAYMAAWNVIAKPRIYFAVFKVVLVMISPSDEPFLVILIGYCSVFM